MRMKKLRSLLCFVMATILMLGSSITVFAADDRVQYATATECEYELPENTDNSSDYFNFVNLKKRMDSNGYFTFSYSWAMYSQHFKPKASSIKVYMKATSSASDKKYYINLYKDGSDSSLGSVTYTADGTSQYYKFTALDTNSSYYLYFSKPLFSNATITGTGHINHIQ